MVAADELGATAVLRALREGSFYSTTGVPLEAVERFSGRLCVRIADYSGSGFRSEYIGTQGRLLSTSEDEQSCQAIEPGGGYVRARVVRSDGARAWVQPIYSSAGR
jgi:hypothetical protein